MELAFDKKSLRRLCGDEAKARKELGGDIAEKLKHRLADLRAANSPIDLIAGLPREINHSGSQLFAVDLSQRHRLIFCSNHQINPPLINGRIDWSRVNRIKVISIGSNYEQ